MNFFDHKNLGNHLLQLCPKVVKHPLFQSTFLLSRWRWPSDNSKCVGSYVHNQYLNRLKIPRITCTGLYASATCYQSQKEEDHNSTTGKNYNLHFVQFHLNFWQLHGCSYHKVYSAGPFEKAVSITGFRPLVCKPPNLISRGLYLKTETEPVSENSWLKTKARLGILPIKTPFLRKLRLTKGSL